MATFDLTVQRLHELLSYNPDTGLFTRLVRTSKRVHVGDVAGWIKTGYMHIMLDGRTYKSHRLAWMWVHGVWPAQVIDRIDGNPTNNRISNLRDVDQTTNAQNKRVARRDNKFGGLLGVTGSKKRWAASIRYAGKSHHLGLFNTPELAHEAYLAAKRIYHPGGVIAINAGQAPSKIARSDTSVSGLTGVYPSLKRWQTRFMDCYLGSFCTPEQAHAAYLSAKQAHEVIC